MTLSLSPLRWTALALAGAAFILALVVQFVPFATFSTTIAVPGTSGATADADAYVWEAQFDASFGAEQSSDQTSWYDNDFDDDDGIGMVRAAAPMLVGAGVLLLVAAVLGLRTATVSAVVAFVGAVVMATAIFLMAQGIKDLFDDQQDWAVGFWLAIAASVLAAGAGVLGLLGRVRSAPPSAF
ncbi:MAG: hypothetical protein AABY18_03295 [Candidatus Thermoplasmatota archaeon]